MTAEITRQPAVGASRCGHSDACTAAGRCVMPSGWPRLLGYHDWPDPVPVDVACAHCGRSPMLAVGEAVYDRPWPSGFLDLLWTHPNRVRECVLPGVASVRPGLANLAIIKAALDAASTHRRSRQCLNGEASTGSACS